MKNDRQMIWVHPQFKKKLKVKASERGISIIKFTEEIANDDVVEFFRYDKNKKFRI